MSQPNSFVHDSVQIEWNEDDSVRTITYQSLGLLNVVNQRLHEGGMQALQRLIEDLLDTVAAIPESDMRKKIRLADKIFGLKPDPPDPKAQLRFWQTLMPTVWAWEDSHEKVHKGTAYSFMAESYLGLGDIPSAYICFFNALEDDKENFPHIPKNLKDASAYCTTSLVDNPTNFLYLRVVVPLRRYLQNFIQNYNVRTSRALTLQTLDQNFLQADSLEDVKRFFVATVHEIYHLAPLNSTRMINNDYSKLKIIDTLFNIGLIVDQILEHSFLQNYSGRKKMARAIYELALHLNWTSLQTSPNPGVFLKRVSPNLNSGTPDQIMPSLLDGSATFDNSPISDPRMLATFIAYHLRNYAGHHLEGSAILVNRYPEILNRIMDAVFVAIESL